ncbi:Tad domain-containing protein [Polaromonas sp. P1(28)-13]|nr:Tad domain-containing protein [Polaromonas sp. P1(28)-13]
MKTSTAPRPTRSRLQRGAVAIMLGLSIFVLFGFMALAIDLGRTYVVRTELQNAADAAALAGAKQLNQTAAGVCCGSDSAVAYAIAMAAQHDFKFSSAVTITIANMSVGTCPDDSCMVPASSITSDAFAGGKTFLKVDIPSGGLATFFAVVPTTAAGTGIPSTSTYGRAVAGRFVNDVTPIGVCAIKDATGVSRPKGEAMPGTNELTQFGFRRGVSYNVFNLGPLGASSDPYLIDPVDVYPDPCNPANSSANITAPFICGGSSAVLTTTPGTVYGNTGISAGKIEAALNSRFNNYGGPSVCIPAQAPPDTNIRPYGFASGVDWMTPTPTVQTMIDPGMPMPPATIASADKYGVLWSYSRAVNAIGVSPNATPGAAFASTDWVSLYPATVGAPAANANFPATGSPYLDPGHSTAPVGNPGLPNRRVLNIAIVDCPNVTGSGSCQVIPVLGIGRFFMQVPADFSGTPKRLDVEFAGLIEPVPVADVKLYR